MRGEGPGTTVTLQSNLMQQVTVVAGGEYRLSAYIRRAAIDRPVTARLQVSWIYREGRNLRPNIRVVPCLVDAEVHSMEVVAPAGSSSAVIRAVAHTSDPVGFDSISFRN